MKQTGKIGNDSPHKRVKIVSSDGCHVTTHNQFADSAGENAFHCSVFTASKSTNEAMWEKRA